MFNTASLTKLFGCTIQLLFLAPQSHIKKSLGHAAKEKYKKCTTAKCKESTLQGRKPNFQDSLVLMVFSSAELSIFLFFNLALGSCGGRYYLFDGDFFSPDCSQKQMMIGKKKKKERQSHVNSLRRCDLQKKKPANHRLNHTIFVLRQN